MSEMRVGWFEIEGVQRGSRTLEQQIQGLEPALAAAAGKTVLDFGAAEGLISREFARRGATHVRGLEVIEGHVAEARKFCEGLPCEFAVMNLNRLGPAAAGELVDIVLALAIIHKLKRPGEALRNFASYARELVVVRMPGFAYGTPPTTFQSERHGKDVVDVALELGRCGFSLDRVERGPWTQARGHEPVLYFRRRSCET